MSNPVRRHRMPAVLTPMTPAAHREEDGGEVDVEGGVGNLVAVLETHRT